VIHAWGNRPCEEGGSFGNCGNSISGAGEDRVMSVSESSMPSMMLEQEAQTFGFLERLFKPGSIGSPQQIQIRDIISYYAKKNGL